MNSAPSVHDGEVRSSTPTVDLVVPVKPLDAAKSRLRGAADRGIGDAGAHAALALALAHDTVDAARAAPGVRRLLVVTSDPVVTAELTAIGVSVTPEGPARGLNAALEHGAAVLRAAGALNGAGNPPAMLGALQADLPALRPDELGAALAAAADLFADGAARRAFCVDADGTGTTLLLCAPGEPLRPCFGAGSAQRHRRSGAHPLPGDWPGLRRDVDTAADLRHAAEIGLGEHTRGLLAPCPDRCRGELAPR